MFHVDASWENLSDRDAIRTLMKQPGLLRFPIVELPLNIQTFHVALPLQRYGQPEYWRRYLCWNLSSAVQLLTGNERRNAKITCQSPRQNSGYDLREVSEVGLMIDAEGLEVYFCRFFDGSAVVDNLQVAPPRIPVGAQIIWSATSPLHDEL